MPLGSRSHRPSARSTKWIKSSLAGLYPFENR
jgi:hypothetical protein